MMMMTVVGTTIVVTIRIRRVVMTSTAKILVGNWTSIASFEPWTGGSGLAPHPRPKIVGCFNADSGHLVGRRSESADQPEGAIRTA